MSASRPMLVAFAVPVALLAALQLVPYGRDHSAPPQGVEPAWDSQRTVELAQRACFDCHSNDTKWPWYSNLAPVSWRIWNHVQEGREHLNFSAFDPRTEKVADAAGEAGEEVTKKRMPPTDYLLAHPEARLTAEEQQALAAGLDATFGGFVESKKPRSQTNVEGGRGEEASERAERSESRERGQQ